MSSSHSSLTGGSSPPAPRSSSSAVGGTADGMAAATLTLASSHPQLRSREVGTQTELDSATISRALTIANRHPPAAAQSRSIVLPRELYEAIFERLAELPAGAMDRADGVEDGWFDEAAILPEIRIREYDLRQLRLVSRAFLHLSTPIYFRWLTITSPTVCARPLWPNNQCASSQHRADTKAVVSLLGASPPPLVPGGERGPAYGTFVRELSFPDGQICTRLAQAVVESVADLMPNLRVLHLFRLYSLLISSAWSDLADAQLPHLEAITETLIPKPDTTGDVVKANTQQSSILDLVDAYPKLSKFSATSLVLTDLEADRFLTTLTANRWSPLADGAQALGLRVLYLATDCCVDLFLLQQLPKAAPNMQQLVVDTSVDIVDTRQVIERFTLSDMLKGFPRLKQFTFLGKPELIKRENSEDFAWAFCSDILTLVPTLEYLYIRADILSAQFFHALHRSSGPAHLLHQRLRHVIITPSMEATGTIVNLDSPRRIRLFLLVFAGLLDSGVSWPPKPAGLASFFDKLKRIALDAEGALDAGQARLIVSVQPDGPADVELVRIGEGERPLGREAPEEERLEKAVLGSSRGVVVRQAAPLPPPPQRAEDPPHVKGAAGTEQGGSEDKRAEQERKSKADRDEPQGMDERDKNEKGKGKHSGTDGGEAEEDGSKGEEGRSKEEKDKDKVVPDPAGDQEQLAEASDKAKGKRRENNKEEETEDGTETAYQSASEES